MGKKKASDNVVFDIKVEEVVHAGSKVNEIEDIEMKLDPDDGYTPYKLEDYKEESKKSKTGKAEIVNKTTKEQNISVRYVNGIRQSYIVELYVGYKKVFNKEKKEFVKKRIRRKKSFKTFSAAKYWRDQEKAKLANDKKLKKDPSTKLWKIDEAISECRVHKVNIERRGDAYMMDFERYASSAMVYFCDANELSEVATIKKDDIENYLLHLKEQHNYSYQTLVKHKSFLNGLWEYMLDREKYDVKRNVVRNAIIPSDQSAYKARMLSQGQIEELIIEACKQEEPFFLFLVVFSITQALRRGELCGLQWGDIDWEKKTITIQNNRIQISGKDRLKDPKQGRIRYIELHKAGYDTLLLYKKWQEDYLKRPVKDNEYVLKTTVNLKYGYDPHTGKISRKWKEIYNKINKQRIKDGKDEIPYGRIHDGRHIYATKLLQGDKMLEKMNEDGKREESIIHPVSYIQVYQSMGHSLPKALQNTTTSKYNEHTDARFEITAFWNRYMTVDIEKEWYEQEQKRADEWEKLTQVQKDKRTLAKESRLEKAYKEKLKGNPPEEVLVKYTKDGPLPTFEEKDL